MASRSIPFLSITSHRPIRFGFRQVWSAMRAMARARTTRRLLAEMDGRMLAEIGVSRTQVDAEISRPFWDTKAQ